MTTELESVASASGDAAAIIDSTEALTLAATGLTLVDEDLAHVYVHTVKSGDEWATDVQDFEKYAAVPRRKQSTIQVATTASLESYLGVHVLPGTTLYADPDAMRIEAILNDHAEDTPGHRDHRAVLVLQKTPGCKRWIAAHGKYLSQEDFAQLIEDGLAEIATPAGADLLELAQTMHATTAANFRSSIRLDSGQVQFQYVEDITATAGKSGDMTIPATVTLVFEPFFGAEPIQLDARLRYRLNGGKLALGVWLIRHEEALRAAFEKEVETLRGPVDEGPIVLYGNP